MIEPSTQIAPTERWFRVVVIELDDVQPRVRRDCPNLYVGLTSRSTSEIAGDLSIGKGSPTWARHHVVRVRDDLAPAVTGARSECVQLRADLIRRLRSKGYTVNRNTTAYRTYVINLHNPNLADVGAGHVYVGQTSKTPEQRLEEHLTGAVNSKGVRLASRVVERFGVDLNYDLMTKKIYLTQNQAKKAERRLAERLREQGYRVEGGH